MNKGALVVGSAAVIGLGILVWASTKSEAGNGGGIKLPSWIPAYSYSQADRTALATYPENPAFGRSVLIQFDTQTTWVLPDAIIAFIQGGWRVLAYPYPT